MIEDDIGGRECGVATEVHFYCGGEPAEIVALLARHNEGRLREVIFSGDILHGCVVKPCIEGAGDEDMDDVSVWTLTPYYYGPGENSTFDFIWMIAGKTAVALGKTHDSFLTENTGLREQAEKFANCTGHSNFASVNHKPTPTGKTPEDSVLTFSDCNYEDGATFEQLGVAMGACSKHLTDKGSEAGIFHWYPVYGGGAEKFDFKWIEAHSNFEAMGVDFDDYGTGCGFETRGELLRPLINCDAARVYRGKSRRFTQLR